MQKRYLTKHPYTGEEIEASNREWRCIKALIPTDSSLWALLSAEKEYALLLTYVTERLFDKPTETWFVEMIEQWPVDVTVSPEALLAWYHYICDYHNIDEFTANLAKAEELKLQLEKIRNKRQKDVGRLAKSIQREIKQLQKLKALKARSRRKLKKRRR